MQLEQVHPNVSGPDQVSKSFNGAIHYADQAAALPTTLMVNPAVVDTVGQRVRFVLNLIRWSGDSEFEINPGDDSIQRPSRITVPAYAAKVEFEGTVKALKPGASPIYNFTPGAHARRESHPALDGSDPSAPTSCEPLRRDAPGPGAQELLAAGRSWCSRSPGRSSRSRLLRRFFDPQGLELLLEALAVHP